MNLRRRSSVAHAARAHGLTIALVVLAVVGCRKSEAPAKSWYDAAPLLASLRPAERSEAAKAAGVAELSELPLYDLELELDPELSKLELGEKLYFTNRLGKPIDEIVLRVFANASREQPLMRLVRGSCVETACEVTQPSPSVIAVKPKSTIAPGARLAIDLRLAGELTAIEASRTTMLAQGLESLERIKSGKGAGDYGLLARGEEIASLASFYPVLARHRDGAWVRQESSALGDLGAEGPSHVRARLRIPADAKLATSGVITADAAAPAEGDAGPERRVEIVAGLVRDFSLLVSRRFESKSRKVGEVEVRSHFLGRDRQSGERVLDAAAESLAVYEKRFGRYPYADLDVVEAPLVGGAGGVEFSGLVTVASMLYHPVLADGPLGALAGLFGGPSNQEMRAMTDSMLEFTTAHEVAHQWFPGLVGSDSRQHPFLDESLAQWSAMLYFEDRHGAERAKSEGQRQVAVNYQMMRLLGLPDAAVDRPVDAFKSEIDYAGLVYGKGPYLYGELRKTLGDEAFFSGLRAHVERHRFRTAAPRALVDELAQGEHAPRVKDLARRWLEEAHGDDDLGKPDLRAILATWLGPEAVKAMGPEVELAMKLVLRLLAGGQADGGDSADLLRDLLGGGKP